MNDEKICFITCVNNEAKYKESLLYISRLNIPEGYKIESSAIRNSSSMASGYNRGMAESDAKFKVYLHQDTFILNRDFIFDLLKIFKSNEKIGLVGVAGAKTIPPDGVWWNSTERVGRVYDNHTQRMELLEFCKPIDSVEDVKAVDGLLFATQYDVPFREDIFNGWDFYDVSEALEFIKHGYRVVVPSPEKVWCLHDCGIPQTGAAFDQYRHILINEYLKDSLPLVSILIPAYNQTKYLKIALESAIAQTYNNIEIIIGDDSTNDEVQNFVKPYLEKYDYIHYFRNKKTTKDYGDSNVKACLKLSKGEYISFLYHDDVIVPEKIEYMMNYALKFPNVKLITSYRKTIDSAGNEIPAGGPFRKIFDSDQLICGKQLIRIVITTLSNIIGEPSVMMIKRECIDIDKRNWYDGNFYDTNCDIIMAFKALEHSDAVYIAKPLTYFRFHDEQNSAKAEIQLCGHIEWLNLLMSCNKKGYFLNSAEYKKTLSIMLSEIYRYSSTNLEKLSEYPERRERLKELAIKATSVLFDDADS